MGRWIAGIIILILIAAGVVAATHKSNNSSSNNNPPTSATNRTNNTTSQQPAASNNEAPAATINIVNMLFTPSQVTVKAGQTVKWTNNDNTTHTVVDDLSNVGGPSSGDIAPGQSYSFTFQKAGSYQYHCSIHPSMRGTIVVQ